MVKRIHCEKQNLELPISPILTTLQWIEAHVVLYSYE